MEALVHNILSEFQISGIKGAREIFACSPVEAEKAVAKAFLQSAKYRKAKEAESKRKKREEKRLNLLKEKWEKSLEKNNYDKVLLELKPLLAKKSDLYSSITHVEREKKGEGLLASFYWIGFAMSCVAGGISGSLAVGFGFAFLWLLLYLYLTYTKKQKKELEKIVYEIERLYQKKEKIKEDFFSQK